MKKEEVFPQTTTQMMARRARMSGEIGKGLPGCHFGPSESSFVVNVRGGEGRVRKRGWLGNCVLKRCSKLFFT